MTEGLGRRARDADKLDRMSCSNARLTHVAIAAAYLRSTQCHDRTAGVSVHRLANVAMKVDRPAIDRCSIAMVLKRRLRTHVGTSPLRSLAVL